MADHTRANDKASGRGACAPLASHRRCELKTWPIDRDLSKAILPTTLGGRIEWDGIVHHPRPMRQELLGFLGEAALRNVTWTKAPAEASGSAANGR